MGSSSGHLPPSNLFPFFFGAPFPVDIIDRRMLRSEHEIALDFFSIVE